MLSVVLFDNELKNVIPKHVEEIIFYLKEHGYKIECFKEMNSSKYILKYKNIFVEFKSCREIVDFLSRKFDESITKTELSNSPLSVAKKIENVVLYFDKKNWIYSLYEYILNEYNLATERGETDKIGIIDNILNKLESLIEKEMEIKIEATRKMISKYDEEYKKIEDLDNKIVELLEKLNMRLDEEDE